MWTAELCGHKLPHYRPGQALYSASRFRHQEFLDNQPIKAVELSALRSGRLSVRGWVDPRATARPEWLCQWKIPMTTSGIEPATFRLVAKSINKLRRNYFTISVRLAVRGQVRQVKVSGLQDAAASCKPDTQPTAPHQTSYLKNHSTKYHRQQPLYNSLEFLMMGIVVPETCSASNKICHKNLCCI